MPENGTRNNKILMYRPCSFTILCILVGNAMLHIGHLERISCWISKAQQEPGTVRRMKKPVVEIGIDCWNRGALAIDVPLFFSRKYDIMGISIFSFFHFCFHLIKKLPVCLPEAFLIA